MRSCSAYALRRKTIERNLPRRLTAMQHGHHDVTVATLHAHLDHDQCIESVILRGPTAAVVGIAQAVIAEKGVRDGDFRQNRWTSQADHTTFISTCGRIPERQDRRSPRHDTARHPYAVVLRYPRYGTGYDRNRLLHRWVQFIGTAAGRDRTIRLRCGNTQPAYAAARAQRSRTMNQKETLSASQCAFTDSHARTNRDGGCTSSTSGSSPALQSV